MTEAEAAAAVAGAELLGKMLELGGRAAEGIFSSPYTGVPFTLLLLAQIDPSGKLTLGFLNNLATWLEAIGTAATKVVSDSIDAWNGTKHHITLTAGTGSFCLEVRIKGWAAAAFIFTPIPQPDTQLCFPTAAERDIALQGIRDRLGPLQAFYDFSTTNNGAAV